MATGVATLPRPATSGGLSLRNLPIIQHPNAGRGEGQHDLTVRGESRASGLTLPGRERTFVSLDAGKLTLGLDRQVLPPLRERQNQGRSRTACVEVTRSQSCNPESGYRTLKGKYQRSIDDHPRFASDDLEWLIQDRLKTGYHGLKHLFRANDPNGQGNVSREALLRILYSLIGYISRDQYHTLLKRSGLEKEPIPFEAFVSSFKENETPPQPAWLAPAQQMQSQERRPQLPEAHTARPGDYGDGGISAAFCHTLLRNKTRSRSFKVKDVLPPCCLEPDGRVLPQQLREIVDGFNISVTDEEFDKLWSRYDSEGVGAVKTSHLLKLLGLDDHGNWGPARHQQQHQRHRRQSKDGSGGRQQSGKHEENDSDKAPDAAPVIRPSEETEKSGGAKARAMMKSAKMLHKKVAPRLENAIDCLHYKFEVPYNSLLMGMQCFDFLGDGAISRIDLRYVLEGFGFNISCTDLEHFLSRCGVRQGRGGELSYKELLMKFWNKSENGLLNRIVTTPSHVFSNDHLPVTADTLTAEQLEAKLIDFMHGDFLRLIGNLKQLDKYGIGVVTQYEFKHAISQSMGYQMSEDQWEMMKATVGLDTDGLVPYPKLLKMFDIRPGSWNKKELGGFMVRQVSQTQPTQQVEDLKMKSQKLCEERKRRIEAQDRKNEKKSAHLLRKKHQEQEEEQELGRTISQLNDLLRDFFRVKFNEFDLAFKALDRRMTGRIYRHNFEEILRQCDFPMTRSESERVWRSMNLPPDGMMHFAALVRQFSDRLVSSERTDTNAIDNDKAENDKTEVPARQVIQKPEKQDVEILSSQEKEGVLERIRRQVVDNWDHVKHQLRQKDNAGSTTVLFTEMKGLLQSLHLPLDGEELDKLLQTFDVNKNGKFHYLDFLKYYTTSDRRGENGRATPHGPVPQYGVNLDYKLHKKQVTSGQEVEHPTIAQVIQQVRTQMLRDWKILRRAFKKLDTGHCGYLSVEDFTQALSSCRLEVEGDDLYHLLTQFDSNMDGRISYDEFITQLLGTV